MRRQRTSRQFAKKSSEKIGIARVREVPNLNIFRIKGALPSGESAFFCLASRPYFPAVSLRSQSAGWLWRSVPYGRTVSFFSHLCSGSVRRRKSIPCFGKLRSAALVHGKGGAETMGFCRRSLETTSLYPPQADTARWFRGSVPVSMPQRGWRSADTTVQTFCRYWQKAALRRQNTKTPQQNSSPSAARRRGCYFISCFPRGAYS